MSKSPRPSLLAPSVDWPWKATALQELPHQGLKQHKRLDFRDPSLPPRDKRRRQTNNSKTSFWEEKISLPNYRNQKHEQKLLGKEEVFEIGWDSKPREYRTMATFTTAAAAAMLSTNNEERRAAEAVYRQALNASAEAVVQVLVQSLMNKNWRLACV